MFMFKRGLRNLVYGLISLQLFCLGVPPVGAYTEEAKRVEPIVKKFIVSAYYSPLPGQKFYYRGTLEAERRLNGWGVHGASGREVFSGMLAAPSTFAFGTKIFLEGIGTGIVHDRGGAIVKAGERSNQYDRIDLWTGSGEEGLKRALTWGKRVVTGYIYPPAARVEGTIDVAQLPVARIDWENRFTLFAQNLGRSDRGAEVTNLQETLQNLGYFDGQISGYYDTKTVEAVYRFQKARGLVHSSWEKAAGYFGPATRVALKEATLTGRDDSAAELQPLVSEVILAYGLKKDTVGEEVSRIQWALKETGYFTSEVTGHYGEQTVEALADFQLENGLIASSNDQAAGYLGYRTSKLLAEKLMQKRAEEEQGKMKAEKSKQEQQKKQLLVAFERKKMVVRVGLKSQGDKIKLLQEQLKKLGYFQGEATGFYGPKTRRAVLAFQSEQKLNSGQAGYVNYLTGRKIAQKWLEKVKNELALKEVGTGDRDAGVRKLQENLLALGYFQGPCTGYYGKATEAAVFRFQKEQGVVASLNEQGAGNFGPATKAKLQALLAEQAGVDGREQLISL
ncbi:hypothetical protein COT40_00775 [Candidatus Peregrinibacteria bacterium CG08_land_8_20_14_0_20_41_10]|nr:MAG: hypothetical protein COT40_00775 [Candidatus Peregrinibacteria bacterium CG08_land_8_20_14_0_20_41_10]